MTTGQTRYADVSSLINDVYEGALTVLREQNLLVRTVRTFTDEMGLQPRKITQYGTANPRQVGEGEDVTPTKFNRTLLNTLTPAEHADQFFLTDGRINTDSENVRADAAMEFGASFAEYVDTKIASTFSSLTGGTISATGASLSWGHITAAYSRMKAAKIPGPYWCALHPYQWHDLFGTAVVAGSQMQYAPMFQDALIQSFYRSLIFGDLYFVISANVSVDSTPDATGAMYSPIAMAYDERVPFYMEPERDASRRGWELNAAMAFAYGVWVPTRGIQIISDATAPTS